MGKGKKSSQGGFTLIEVMVVAAVLGVLASILLPEMRGYQARAKVSEALLLFSSCRNIVHEIYESGANRPAADSWGCEADGPSRYVAFIRTNDDGVIRLTLGNQVGDLRLALHDITLAPLNGAGTVMREEDLGTPVRRWRCGSPADGTDLKPDFLPSSCRG